MDAVPGQRHENRLHVFGNDVVAAGQARPGAGGGEQGQPGPRRQAQAHLGMLAAGLEQGLDVGDQRRPGRKGVGMGDLCRQTGGAQYGAGIGQAQRVVVAGQQLPFGLGIGVAQVQAEHESVQLRFGQRVGADQIKRILGGDDEERRGQFPAHAIDADLAFGHRFQQGALGLGRCPVQFIDQQQLREHRAGMEAETAIAAVEHRDADDVGRQQVAGALDAVEIQPQGLGQGVRQRGLAHARNILDQQMAAGQKAGKRQAHFVLFAQDDAVDLGQHGRQ